MANPERRPEIAAPALHVEKNGGGTVTVACKFPPGIVLQLCRKVSYMEQSLTGPIERERFDKVGQKYYVRGNAEVNGQVPKGYKRPDIEGGYALTRGIPADFWREWLRQNSDFPMVTNKLIFATTDYADTVAKAIERAGLKSGFEPIVPDDDPRAPKSLNPAISSIETGTTSET